MMMVVMMMMMMMMRVWILKNLHKKGGGVLFEMLGIEVLPEPEGVGGESNGDRSAGRILFPGVSWVGVGVNIYIFLNRRACNVK